MLHDGQMKTEEIPCFDLASYDGTHACTHLRHTRDVFISRHRTFQATYSDVDLSLGRSTKPWLEESSITETGTDWLKTNVDLNEYTKKQTNKKRFIQRLAYGGDSVQQCTQKGQLLGPIVLDGLNWHLYS